MPTKLAKNLTFQVLVAMVLGALVGVYAPAFASQLQFVSDGFVRLVKMVIAPIVFITLVTGLSGMGSLKEVGSLGLRALLYFEVVTSLALALGVGMAVLLQPGAGFDVHHAHVKGEPAALSHLEGGLGHAHAATTSAAGGAKAPGAQDFRTTVLHMLPDSAVGALASSDLLPTLTFALFFGLAMTRTKPQSAALAATLERLGAVFFDVVALVMQLSPLAAFAAMAYAIGQFGLGSLWALGKLLADVYLAMGVFFLLVLAPICWLNGFRLTRLLRHIGRELLLVLGTSSSESALPGLIERLTQAGCARSVVGLVVPTGYSFNLDGTSIYLSMSVLFVAQAYGVPLSWGQIGWILAVLMLTSKGAAGVSGSGFVTLAATLSALPGQPIPLEGLVLLVGVDRFMSTARALTNLVGNSVACVVLAKRQGQFVDQHLL